MARQTPPSRFVIIMPMQMSMSGHAWAAAR